MCFTIAAPLFVRASHYTPGLLIIIIHTSAKNLYLCIRRLRPHPCVEGPPITTHLTRLTTLSHLSTL